MQIADLLPLRVAEVQLLRELLGVFAAMMPATTPPFAAVSFKRSGYRNRSAEDENGRGGDEFLVHLLGSLSGLTTIDS